MKISRKEFLKVGALAGAAVTLIITGCGGDDDGDGTGGAGGSGGGSGGSGGSAGGTGGSGGSTSSPCTADITSNHGHTLDIPAADLDSTDPKTYDIHGGGTHGHTISLSAAELAQLKGGASVSVDSSIDNAHSHSVTITCA